jgi:hypothetical protein
MRETCAFWAKCGLVCLMVLVGAGSMNSGRLAAQSSDPSGLPLLSQSGLEYVGGFRLPNQGSNGEWFSFGGFAVAYNPLNNSLFVSSYHGAVAEVSIPTPGNSSDFRALPFSSYLQGFADPTEGRLTDVASGGVSLSSLMVKGNRLYGTASIYYDANNTQRLSHFSRSLQLNQPSFSGWSQVADEGRQGFVSGWMTALPSAWQAKLGGSALTGQCCIPIVWRTSVGPAALAFEPSSVGQPVVSANPLVYYTSDHATLGSWEGSNPTYGATTQMGGIAAIAGTRTVLYFGTNGLGEHCYGNGTADKSLEGTIGTDGAHWCYDPTNNSKSSHAYPYRYQVWAYDLNDFAAVKAGTKQPWEVVPYGVWPLNFPTPEPSVRLGGVGYDPERQLLYVSQLHADAEGYSSQPIIHVFHLNAAPAAAAAPANTVSYVTIASNKTAPQAPGTAIIFTAQPTGGVAPYQYKWLISDGVTTTVAANWTASNQFTWTPATANSKYVVSVWVRSAGQTADALEASASSAFAIGAAEAKSPASSVTLVANRVAPQAPFTAITWTATPVGGVAPHEYKWLVFDGVTSTVALNWSASNSFVWTPSTANSNYRVEVWVRSAGNTSDIREASASAPFPIAATSTTAPAPPNGVAPVSSVTLTSSKPSPQPAGASIVFTAKPVGGVGPYQYQWLTFEDNTWTPVGGWGNINTMTWSRNTSSPKYQVQVRVRSAGSTNANGEATATMPFVLNNGNGKSK